MIVIKPNGEIEIPYPQNNGFLYTFTRHLKFKRGCRRLVEHPKQSIEENTVFTDVGLYFLLAAYKFCKEDRARELEYGYIKVQKVRRMVG